MKHRGRERFDCMSHRIRPGRRSASLVAIRASAPDRAARDWRVSRDERAPISFVSSRRMMTELRPHFAAGACGCRNRDAGGKTVPIILPIEFRELELWPLQQ